VFLVSLTPFEGSSHTFSGLLMDFSHLSAARDLV